MNKTAYVVQTKSNWQGDNWQTVDYFSSKNDAENKAKEIRSRNTGDIKRDVNVRVNRKRLSMQDLENAARNF